MPPSTTSEVATNIVVHPGERPKALEFIKRWVENNVRDYIKISDPYFGPSELELVKLIRAVDKEVPIEILTSRHHINQECGESSVEEAFRHYWRMHLSSEDAGDTTITVAGGKASGQYALHDRWWLTYQSGLRVGTSFGSLGITKEAEISTIDFDESVSMALDVDNYLSRKVREFRGDRMIYSVFTLD